MVEERKRQYSKNEKEKKNEILAKNANMTQKHVTAVKHWSPLSSYCSALPDLSLVFFPGMSVSQPFPKGSGDNNISNLVRMVESLVDLYLNSHIHPGYLCLSPIPTHFESTKNTQCQNLYHP